MAKSLYRHYLRKLQKRETASDDDCGGDDE